MADKKSKRPGGAGRKRSVSSRSGSRGVGHEHEAALFAAVEGLSRLAEAFEHRRQQLARQLDLSDAQLRVIEEIARDDFMPSLFARRRACSAAAISRTLRQLQDQGLVRAAIGMEDGRQRAYSLTAKGRRLIDRLRAGRLAAVDRIWRDLATAELADFGALSHRLADRLDVYAERLADGD